MSTDYPLGPQRHAPENMPGGAADRLGAGGGGAEIMIRLMERLGPDAGQTGALDGGLQPGARLDA